VGAEGRDRWKVGGEGRDSWKVGGEGRDKLTGKVSVEMTFKSRK